MRALKESWKEAPQAIEELEKEGEVLVTRTVKDGQLRMVFWNEIKPLDDNGGVQVEKGTPSSILIHLLDSRYHQNFSTCGTRSKCPMMSIC